MRKGVSKMKETKENDGLVLFEDVVKKFAEDYKITDAELVSDGYDGSTFLHNLVNRDAKTGLVLSTIFIKSILESNYKNNCLGIDNTKLIEMINEVLNSDEAINIRCTNIKKNSSKIQLVN